jgi:hypothetical protein
LTAFIIATTPATNGADALVPPKEFGLTGTPNATDCGSALFDPSWLGGYAITGMLLGANRLTWAPKFEYDAIVVALLVSAPTQMTCTSMQGWTRLSAPTSKPTLAVFGGNCRAAGRCRPMR